MWWGELHDNQGCILGAMIFSIIPFPSQMETAEDVSSKGWASLCYLGWLHLLEVEFHQCVHSLFLPIGGSSCHFFLLLRNNVATHLHLHSPFFKVAEFGWILSSFYLPNCIWWCKFMMILIFHSKTIYLYIKKIGVIKARILAQEGTV